MLSCYYVKFVFNDAVSFEAIKKDILEGNFKDHLYYIFIIIIEIGLVFILSFALTFILKTIYEKILKKIFLKIERQISKNKEKYCESFSFK